MRGWMGLLLLAAASCNGASYVCNCPANGCDHGCDPTSQGVGEVLLSGFPAVSSASANAPCATDYQPSADRILVSRPGTGTCDVNVQFVDGSSYAAQILFKKIDAPCGCYIGSFASALAPVDAGSD